MAKKRKPSKRRREAFEESTHIKQGSIKVKQRKLPKASVPRVIGKARKLNQVEKDYRKQEQRIKQFIRRAEKRGYLFDYQLPTEPSKVTRRDVNRLKGVKPDYLYTKATYVNKETGEVFTGTQRRAQERKEAAAKGQRTRREKQNKGAPPSRVEQILSYIESEISWYEQTYSSKKRYTAGGKDITWIGFAVRDFYNEQLAKYGRVGVAKIVEPHPEIMEYAHDACRDSKAEWAETSLNRFITVLKGEPLTDEEARAFSEDTDYNEDLDELPF